MQYLEYNEVRQRGTLEFPLEIHHITSIHPHYAMPCHWHREYELIRVLKGEFQIFLNEEPIKMKQGDVLFIPGGVLHTGTPEECIYECIVFDPAILSKEQSVAEIYFRRLQNPKLKVMNWFPAAQSMIPTLIFQLFEQIWEKKEGYQLIALGLLLQFFGTIFTNHYYQENQPSILPNQRRLEQLKAVIAYIEKNYTDSISLADLSETVGMSPKYFCRFFQEMIHLTPISYVNSYRIERAAHQLATTGNSITEVAYACGFNDLSYFIKTFRKYKGVTPKKYLNQELK